MRRIFYEINPEKYLFGMTPSPEETVRQWALYQLLTCNGININDIEIESPVKLGSSTLRIDILVYREGRPYIIVECKALEKNDDHALEKAMKQAISYAEASSIRAPFVIVTNGNVWQVKCLIDYVWRPVHDIPRIIDENLYGDSFEEYEQTVTIVTPLLLFVGCRLPAKDVSAFWSDIQSCILELVYADFNLVQCIDFLCRLFDNPAAIDDFAIGTIHTAGLYFCEFLKKQGISFSDAAFLKDDRKTIENEQTFTRSIEFRLNNTNYCLNQLGIGMHRALGLSSLAYQDAILLRVMAVALEYLTNQRRLFTRNFKNLLANNIKNDDLIIALHTSDGTYQSDMMPDATILLYDLFKIIMRDHAHVCLPDVMTFRIKRDLWFDIEDCIWRDIWVKEQRNEPHDYHPDDFIQTAYREMMQQHITMPSQSSIWKRLQTVITGFTAFLHSNSPKKE